MGPKEKKSGIKRKDAHMNKQKIIDFHIHFFPDLIAKKAIASIRDRAAEVFPLTLGTKADTLRMLEAWGIDEAVYLPIATKPSQQQTINAFAASVNGGKIYSYGSVHPFAPDALEELEKIKEMGLYGVKLHPEYQNFFLDDPLAMKVYARCGELGLPVLYHAGEDLGFAQPYHSDPQKIIRIVDELPEVCFIAAHMGGYRQWENVLENLAGKNIYLDTAFIADRMDKDIAKKIIDKHGADKILFGSDCPWASSAETVNFINDLGLPEKDRDAIFSGNAQRLLGIN